MTHTRIGSPSKLIATAIKLSVAVFFIEALGGFLTGSLALLSDASHVFSDLLALIVTLFSLWIASLPSDSRRTFGFHRAEVLGALINGMLLLIMAGSIGGEAWGRLIAPPRVNGLSVLLIGFVGLLPNLWVTLSLRRSSNLSVRSAFWHAFGDTLSSVAVLISAALMLITKNSIFDPLASLIIVAILLLSAFRLLYRVFAILIEGTPENMDRKKISRLICATPGVRSTHDLHLWSLCSDIVYFTGHLVIDGSPNLEKAQATVDRATDTLKQSGIHHATLQIETPGHTCTKEEKCEILH